ncbi:LysR family transcriptional regulator [Pontimicrobium aquaticum]|uniref:LysR family transcriptional regulator n=1 Tax=Pontimicrobium aquaticum TaxID=2565367 RepID=A0A4U0EVH9_9FLAO|nr:LysR family transcriptional regulator [Pontimicrobium aquaticum]TJY35936.1 LysR family transcriptional regulator [Pontimicrobium aquaticum]
MELRQLKYFIKAKELLNFTAAAATLNISQSTLSQQIKQLEIELDVPLFERIGKRIKLTEAGDLFYKYALQSVNSANSGFNLLRDFKNIETGELKIGSTYGLRHVLTKSVKQFVELYPKIKISIVFGTSEALIEKLDNFELDFILSFQEYETDKAHRYQLLFTSEMVLIGATNSKLKEVKNIKMKNLVHFSLALPSSGFNTRKYIDKVCNKKNLSLNSSLEINDIPMLLDLVKTGKYYTILAKTTIQDINSIISVPIIQPSMKRKGMIISLNEVYEKKAVKAFYKIIYDIINTSV